MQESRTTAQSLISGCLDYTLEDQRAQWVSRREQAGHGRVSAQHSRDAAGHGGDGSMFLPASIWAVGLVETPTALSGKPLCEPAHRLVIGKSQR